MTDSHGLQLPCWNVSICSIKNFTTLQNVLLICFLPLLDTFSAYILTWFKTTLNLLPSVSKREGSYCLLTDLTRSKKNSYAHKDKTEKSNSIHYHMEHRYLIVSSPCWSAVSEEATVRRWMMDCGLDRLWLTARKTSSWIQVRKLSFSGFTSWSSLFSNWILF